MEVLEVVGSMSCPVLGDSRNHDHGGVGGSGDVKTFSVTPGPCPAAPARLEPVLVAGITVRSTHCCVSTKHNLLWLEQLDWQTLDASAPRVVLAYGSVQGFGGDDSVNRLLLDRLPSDELDYVASVIGMG